MFRNLRDGNHMIKVIINKTVCRSVYIHVNIYIYIYIYYSISQSHNLNHKIQSSFMELI